MRDAIVKVHNQAEYHPNSKPHQRQYAQFENQVDIHCDRNRWYEWKSGCQEC